MTDFSNQTHDQVAEVFMDALLELEARANAESPVTPELLDVRKYLAKSHLSASLALVASNAGGYTSFSGGDPKP